MVLFEFLSPRDTSWLCLASPKILARVLALAGVGGQHALLPPLAAASWRAVLSFWEVHSHRVQRATKWDEKGPRALRELTTPCKRQDSVTQTSAATDTGPHTNGSNQGHLEHGNHMPSLKPGHWRCQDTEFRALWVTAGNQVRGTLLWTGHTKGDSFE